MILLLYLASVAIQVMLHTGLFILLRKRETPATTTGMAIPVSVIVCARDEIDNLRELIPLLLAQDYHHKEIVIVNDGSQDGSRAYLEFVRSKYKALKVIHLVNKPRGIPGKKYPLARGIAAASHQILLLTDADCRPISAHWIREMTETFSDPEVQFVLGFSPYKKMHGLLNAFIQYETLQTALLYMGAALAGKPYMAVGRNLAYRKSVFINGNGFKGHESVMGGDDDLFVQAHANGRNTGICMKPAAKIISYPKVSLKSYFKQKKRHLEVGKNYINSVKLLLGIVSFSQIVFWICMVYLLLMDHNYYLICGGFLIRAISLIIVVKYFSFILQEKINPILFIILDFLYVFYYIIIGSSAIFSKVNRWN